MLAGVAQTGGVPVMDCPPLRFILLDLAFG